MGKNKDTQIQLRISSEEKEQLKGTAEALNMGISDYIRARLDNKDLIPPLSEIEQQKLSELSKIGNMLNELMTLVRDGKAPKTPALVALGKALIDFVNFVGQQK